MGLSESGPSEAALLKQASESGPSEVGPSERRPSEAGRWEGFALPPSTLSPQIPPPEVHEGLRPSNSPLREV